MSYWNMPLIRTITSCPWRRQFFVTSSCPDGASIHCERPRCASSWAAAFREKTMCCRSACRSAPRTRNELGWRGRTDRGAIVLGILFGYARWGRREVRA